MSSAGRISVKDGVKAVFLCLASLFISVSAHAANILFVVGNTTLNSGDQAVYDRLTNEGHTVTTVSGPASQTSDANGRDLVVISSTVTSGDVNTKFTNVAVPVLCGEPALWDDMRYQAAPGTNLADQTSLEI
ncbi:MAG TPA: hypothetical protein P5511_07305, partial [Candidatus Goldiibacteriota bacterium]|nr:hypothetical protein [Candidatus Goldiibacteriota bacterium]